LKAYNEEAVETRRAKQLTWGQTGQTKQRPDWAGDVTNVFKPSQSTITVSNKAVSSGVRSKPCKRSLTIWLCVSKMAGA
jgi:hypothetical protein